MIELTELQMYNEMKVTAETVHLHLLEYGIKVNYKFILPDTILFYVGEMGDDNTLVVNMSFVIDNNIQDYEIADWFYDLVNN